MPPGTLYADYHEGQGWPLGPTDVFIGDIDYINDFHCADLHSPESSGSSQLFERHREMDEQGAEYPIALDVDREGLYEDDTRYLVWEVADVAAIVARSAWLQAKQGEWNGTPRFRVRKADGTLRFETAEDDARKVARPGDIIERMYEQHQAEWRRV